MNISDLTLRLCHQIGDKVERDTSCDSTYMLGSMDRVGKAIRTKMSWVDNEKTIHLFMDRAGGHGTEEAINSYKNHCFAINDTFGK